MKKHAYLIMAHNEFKYLKKLIILLDDYRNDIYLHVDKKARAFNVKEYENLTRKSHVYFVERNKVSWGAYSQIDAELLLLKAALNSQHEYYHLLSGVDLPVKSQDEIHAYFDLHAGKEFLSFHDEYLSRASFINRLRYYHFFQDIIGHKKGRNLFYQLNILSIKLQEVVGIDRIRHTKCPYRKGTTWFSITHDLANYVVSREKHIQEKYRFTMCADEVFLHTLAWNSDFKDSITFDALRYIDWKRGRPYTFRLEDFDALVNSNSFWARKFSENVDAQIVEKVFNTIYHLQNPK